MESQHPAKHLFFSHEGTEKKERNLGKLLFLLQVLFDIKMQSFRRKVHKNHVCFECTCACVSFNVYSLVVCVSLQDFFFFFLHGASQAVGAAGKLWRKGACQSCLAG